MQTYMSRNYPHSLLLDNDPKHTSRAFTNFLIENRINHVPSPPQSPDITSGIECAWHELIRYLNSEYLPKNEDLIRGIQTFWSTRMTIEKCNRYIDHKFSTIPAIVLNKGHATGM